MDGGCGRCETAQRRVKCNSWWADLSKPPAETQPPPDERLPPRKTRTPLRGTAARTPELHRQRNALKIDRSDPTLKPLPTNADQDLPTPSGPTDLKMLSHTFFLRELLQGGRAARRWQVLVGVRWQRFQCRVARLYFQRVSLPVQFWRACGCPPQWRPRLPWWQPFVFSWLRLSGWLR